MVEHLSYQFRADEFFSYFGIEEGMSISEFCLNICTKFYLLTWLTGYFQCYTIVSNGIQWYPMVHNTPEHYNPRRYEDNC
jgi:hypothetical protein